ncbi:MAG: D-alanine--D-alanine ligase [Verrucomicrobium sp.]|nr:D-alanine--D-alanine ligase [Verrucomicrobium sp.]
MSAKPSHVAVLKGGPSAEREVSLRTGAACAAALRERGYTVDEIDVAGRDFTLPAGVEFVFISLHGAFGEDGEVQAYLEKHGFPYSGSGVAASRLAIDKEASKEAFRRERIPTPEGVTVGRGDPAPALQPPLVVKPYCEGSSLGMSFVFEEKELAPALDKAFELGERAVVERYIKGRELTVSILGGEALPIVEIAPKEGFYDYTNKYTAGKTDYLCPAPLDAELTRRVQEISLRAHRALGCEVYSRVDIMLDADSNPYVLEVNTIPGMTATSLLPKAAAAAGIPFPELCERILLLSLQRFPATV